MGKDHVLICKGAVEEVLKVCTQLKVDDKILPMDVSVHTRVADLQQKLNSDGLRVIAVAYKTIPIEQSHCAIDDESDLILLGNIAFLDPPKDSVAQALKALKRNGVEVKILTGDNDIITRKICRDVGLPVQNVLLGSDIESLADSEAFPLASIAMLTRSPLRRPMTSLSPAGRQTVKLPSLVATSRTAFSPYLVLTWRGAVLY